MLLRAAELNAYVCIPTIGETKSRCTAGDDSVESPQRADSGGSGGDGHSVAPSRRAEWTQLLPQYFHRDVAQVGGIEEVLLEDPPAQGRGHNLRRTDPSRLGRNPVPGNQTVRDRPHRVVDRVRRHRPARDRQHSPDPHPPAHHRVRSMPLTRQWMLGNSYRQLLGHVREHCSNQVVPTPDVPTDQRQVHVRLGGHVPKRHRVDPPQGEQGRSRIQNSSTHLVRTRWRTRTTSWPGSSRTCWSTHPPILPDSHPTTPHENHGAVMEGGLRKMGQLPPNTAAGDLSPCPRR